MKLVLPELQKVTRETGERYYVTPEGRKYPSVTTVLSEEKKKELRKWREWVGEEEANRIKQFAANRGSRFHTHCENFLTNKPVENTIGIMFDQFTPLLNRIGKIICLEQHLYSNLLRVAGQVDCVGEFDRFPSIIDFKTSSKPKSREHIWDYFMQASAYSYMLLERTGIDIQMITILISCETPSTTQIFIDKRDNWLHKFKELRNKFDDTNIVSG